MSIQNISLSLKYEDFLLLVTSDGFYYLADAGLKKHVFLLSSWSNHTSINTIQYSLWYFP